MYFFTSFVRNFRRQKFVGTLSLIGLSISAAAALLIGLWAIGDFNYDRFHRDADRIYRASLSAAFNGQEMTFVRFFSPAAQDIAAVCPEVEDYCRIVTDYNSMNVKVGEKEFFVDNPKLILVDDNFCNFFTYKLKEGTPETAISRDAHRIVVVESLAREWFPEGNAYGQTVELNEKSYTIGGILEDMPHNTILREKQLILPIIMKDSQLGYGRWDSFLMFFRLQKGADVQKVTDALTNVYYNVGGEFGQAWRDIAKTQGTLQPLNKVHFQDPKTQYAQLVTCNKSVILTYLLCAAIILLLACINFTNMFVSTSFLRAKSVGVKKSFGATRGALMREFYSETGCYAAVALLAGLLIAWYALPAFRELSGADLELSFANPVIYLYLIGLWLLIVLMAGTFPATYMTRFQIKETIGDRFKGRRLAALQRTLVIIQFTASITLLLCIFFIQQQLTFMINRDLGFNKDQVLTYYMEGMSEHKEVFEGELNKLPQVKEISYRLYNFWDYGQGQPTKTPEMEKPVTAWNTYVAWNFFDFMDIPLVEGEIPFRREFEGRDGDEAVYEVVMNQKAAESMGGSSIVGKVVSMMGTDVTVKGIVGNIQHGALTEAPQPEIYHQMSSRAFRWNGVNAYIRFEGDPTPIIAAIRQLWENFKSEYTNSDEFGVSFLDKDYEKLYWEEMQYKKVLIVAVVITLVISIIGLFAMAYFTTQRKRREIGLRKLHGASVQEVLLMLSRGFLSWVAIAFVLACPLTYLIMQRYMEHYVEHIGLHFGVFALVGLLALLLSFLTLFSITFRAANANPVDCLKDE